MLKLQLHGHQRVEQRMDELNVLALIKSQVTFDPVTSFISIPVILQYHVGYVWHPGLFYKIEKITPA